MAIDKIIKHLSCLRCGTRNNLTYYEYKKSRYKKGIRSVYTVDTLKMPICYNCGLKIRRWKWFLYLSIAGLVIWIAAFIIPPLITRARTIEGGIIAYGGFIFANLIIFLFAHLNNPRTYVKFDSKHKAYVRPVGSNKWVSFENWVRVTFSDFSIYTDSKEKPINPLVWKFPLLGGIIILISVVTPSFIWLFSDNSFALNWIPLISFDSAVEFGDYTRPVFYYNYNSAVSNPVSFISIVAYFIFVGGAYFVVQKAYILKRAGSFIKSVGNYLFIIGAVFIIIILILLFLNFPTSGYEGTFFISSGIYGVLAGGSLITLAPAIQKITQSKM